MNKKQWYYPTLLNDENAKLIWSKVVVCIFPLNSLSAEIFWDGQ
jgi:hypothetical protein